MIYEECSSLDMTEQEFENVYNECTNEKFNSIYIEKRKDEMAEKFWSLIKTREFKLKI